MPTITSIKQQKNKNRINVYLDGEFGFGIDLDNFVLLHLKVDQQLTEKEVREIVHKAEFQKDLDKTLRFATVRPRSEKEIRDYFKRKNYDALMHDKLIERLKHFDLLDDKKFAKWWAEQRLLQKKSLRRMIYDLRFKGVKKEIISEVLGEMKIDEEKVARELLEKKAYKWKNLEPHLRRQKITRYLAGRGFSWEVIEKVV